MKRATSLALVLAGACASAPGRAAPAERNWAHPGERHFRFVRRLTHGGRNAEAYFSRDRSMIVFQSDREGTGGDQIYLMSPDGTRITRVSNGTGRCTCAYFLSDNRILFSSTHHYGSAPPPRPEPPGGGYAWPVFREYDIFLLDPYENALTQLTDSPGYDAEATVHWPTDTIVFTSHREGDIDLYLMRADGREVRRLTRRLGYEGGAVISPDGRRVVFRAYYPETDEEAEAYRSLLGMNLVQPPHLELYVMDIDGTNVRQLTSNGGVNFAPFWHPDGERIIFMSNLHEVGRHEYDLYMIRADGTGLERITTAAGFDGFPVFSPDGRHLLWISKRADPHGRDMDVYLAEWVD